MNKADLDAHRPAYQENFKYHSENIGMLSWYASKVASAINTRFPERVLSLGIGHQVTSNTIIAAIETIPKKYLIVEGSGQIIQDYCDKVALPQKVEIVHSLFENFESNESFDIIEMGFVLEHVDDPSKILSHYKGMLKKNGDLFIAVPNARSLHRILGYHAGLLDDLYQLSDADLNLGHKRYFDLERIKNLIMDSGLIIRKLEGIYLKPFTTDQIAKLHLSNDISRALFKIGVHYPELSNAIFVEAGI